MTIGDCRRFALAWVCAAASLAIAGARDAFESKSSAVPETPIDRLVAADLKEVGLSMAPAASDEVFFRRVYLDVIGLPPSTEALTAFLKDKSPDKRTRLIDKLLDEPRFADRWSMKWADLLRVKAEFPINLWPNAVQAYHGWIHESLVSNKPYDQFVREMLTTSGSNFRDPPVNFYRALQGRKPENIAAVVALTFMGSRLETWPADRRAGMEQIFSRVAYKPTAEWKEEIVYNNPAINEPLSAILPDGTILRVASGDDPRVAFADWLIRPDNPHFTQPIVNRAWYWLVGRGIIHEPDDIRSDNPPINPELMAHLQSEFARSKYDLKHLFRLILNSRAYQQSSIAVSPSQQQLAEQHFGCYTPRRLDAEILSDAMVMLFGGAEGYESPIPEPFTHVPSYYHATQLADASTTSTFLELFGRSPRDTGLESERSNQTNARQRMYLLNSSAIQKQIMRSRAVRDWVSKSKTDDALVENIYLGVLTRRPTPHEIEVGRTYIKQTKEGRSAAATDLAWALINSREFLYRH